MSDGQHIGYSTKAAFRILHDDISREVDRYKASLNEPTCSQLLYTSMFHHNNRLSVLHWVTCVIILLQSVFLLVAYGLGGDSYRDDWLAVEALFILLLLLANIYLLVWDQKLYNNEMVHAVHRVLKVIEVGASKGYVWNSANYLNVNTPISPCIGVQWTYRDGEVVNLPTSLLVKGDVIVLRPGQEVEVKCQRIENSDTDQSVLHPGDVFAPEIKGKLDGFCEPQGRTPLQPETGVVLETPFAASIHVVLTESHNKPCSVLENELYVASTFWMEKVLFPAVFTIVVITGLLRYFFLTNSVGAGPEMWFVLPFRHRTQSTLWAYRMTSVSLMIYRLVTVLTGEVSRDLVDQLNHWNYPLHQLSASHKVNSILPLCPLVLPVLCKVLNMYCAARVITVFEVAKLLPQDGSKKKEVDEYSTASSEIEQSAVVNFTWSQVWHHFKKVVSGHDLALVRTANVAHALGHVTTLCCVDKKGILSYANPSPEKVFFFTSESKGKGHKVSTSAVSQRDDQGRRCEEEEAACSDDSYVEVLDLTHNAKNAFGVQFDDPSFQKYLTSLKPLGLNILLNTCNLDISSHYTHFADHVTCASLKNEDAVAVVNRRCLCSLAREIGFTDQATDIFTLQDSLGFYQHVSEKSSHQFTSHSFSKHRVPMPNIMSVLQQDTSAGTCHLFSQGTADILLECCSDFWNGSEILPLTPSDRKKILDFYHRTSMSSYCTAYAYRPVMQTICDGAPDVYIELPPTLESSPLHHNRSFPSTVFNGVHDHKIMESFHSLDSLLDTTSDHLVDRVDKCYEIQKNQVFIGMVTMQYQTKQDMIQMIDGLEKACIRFVHFSNENELRSRVFSEKMGLEAGWNCHISLSNEHTSGRSRHVSDSEKHRSRMSVHTITGQDIGASEILWNHSVKRVDKLRSRCLSAPTVICRVSKPKLRHSVETRKFPWKHLNTLSMQSEESPSKKVTYHHGKSLEFMDRPGRKPVDEDQREPLVGEDAESMDSLLEDTSLLHALKTVRQSGSRETTNTDSLSGLDTLNRAKLPKGIENIRPHLDLVDNVPLLVSLFTDCTSETTREMICIMQEHGEVVCCIGSDASLRNVGIFVQADVSFALTPLFPHVCSKQPAMLTPWDENDPSPMDVNAMLNSIACPLRFKISDNVSVLELICEARHLMASMRNSLLLMFSCLLTLTFIQVVASFGLPPPLRGYHVLWLSCFVVPLLSLTVMGVPKDSGCITHVPYGKNNRFIKKKYVGQYLKSYIFRFLPSSAVCLICFGLTLYSMCEANTVKTGGECHALFGAINSSDSHWNGWTSEYRGDLTLAQNWLVFQLLLYFICTSWSYMPCYNFKIFLRNKFWIWTCCILLILQVIYFSCDLVVHSPSTGDAIVYLSHVPIATWVMSFTWPFLLIPLNLLIKFYDTKLMRRYQKRERLNFGTKLGMNSPF